MPYLIWSKSFNPKFTGILQLNWEPKVGRSSPLRIRKAYLQQMEMLVVEKEQQEQDYNL